MPRQGSWAAWRVLLELHETAPFTAALVEISSLHRSPGPRNHFARPACFSPSLSEILDEPWGSGRPWAALPNGALWVAQPTSVCLALIDGEISKLTEEMRFRYATLLKYELHADALLPDCKITEIIFFFKGGEKKRLVKADSTNTLCFEHVFNEKKNCITNFF